nr:unnamed protein product [Callosobruchus chinensis]
MGKVCVSCDQVYSKDCGVSFHRFPTNPDKRSLWCQRLNLDSTRCQKKFVYLCSQHFDEDSFYITPSGIQYIKEDALPSLTRGCSQATEGGKSSGEAAVLMTDSETATASTLTATSGTLTASEGVISIATNPSGSRVADDNVGELSQIPNKKHRRSLQTSYLAKLRKICCAEHDKALNRAQRRITMYKCKINSLQQQNRRLKAKLYSHKSLTEYLRRNYSLTENAEFVLNASLGNTGRALFGRCLKGKTKQFYTPTLRSFALTLHFYNPKAYDFVRSQLNSSLPHPHTLTKWYQRIDGSPGFSKEAKDTLKLKVQAEEEECRKVLCNLVLDSMAIHKRIEWNGQKFTGYVDLGFKLESDEVPEAKEAIVFMLVALNGSWKLPIAYFCISGLSGAEQASLVNNLLRFIHDTGVIVCSVTFDGARQNVSMAEHLGANLNLDTLQASFAHPVDNHKVFLFFDACHMLKLVRNCLATYKTLTTKNNETIDWQYFEKLVAVQNKEGLTAATKLRKRHIQWENEKMKVSLAAQTFSRSVADALRFLEKDLALNFNEFQGAEATANFSVIINNIFDIFNSKSRYSTYEYKKGINSNNASAIFKFLEQCKDYIKGLKVGNTNVLNCRRKTGFLGFIICIDNLQAFYMEYVIKYQYLSYILTYKMSQDHIELFFSAIRSKGGSNNNPTARQFEAIYKRLLLHSEIKGTKTANVVAIDNTSILGRTYINTLTKTNFGEHLEETEEYINDSEETLAIVDFLLQLWQLTPYVCDIVAYIAGFVVKNLKKCIACDDCRLLIETTNTHSLLQKRKQYGSLTNASPFVITVCQQAERSIRSLKSISNIFHKKHKNVEKYLINYTLNNINKIVFNVFGDHVLDDNVENNHSTTLTKLILQKYIRIRIHHESNIASEPHRHLRSRLMKTITFKYHFEWEKLIQQLYSHLSTQASGVKGQGETDK